MEPVSLAGTLLLKLWKDGDCFGSQFLGGVVGNLLASLGYDHLVKPGVEKTGARVRELLETGGSEKKNHDLLRAIRYAECDALVALCDETLVVDFGVEPEILKTPVEDPKQLLRRFRDEKVKALLALRSEFKRAAQAVEKAPLEELEAQAVSLIHEIPAVLRFGDAITATAGASSEGSIGGQLRRIVTERFSRALSESVKNLPAQLHERIDARWFDAFRIAFHERMKTEPRAKSTFELDVLSHLEGVPEKLDEMLVRLDRIDAALQDLRELHDEISVNVGRLLAGQDGLREELLGLPIIPYVAPKRDESRKPDKRTSDLYLIQPRYRTTELVGRDKDLDDLWSWLHGADAVSVRLLIGRAGSGKTRLAYELLLRLYDAKGASWQGGVVAHETLAEFKALRWAHWTWWLPTLLVIDYAQRSRRPLEEMLKALAAHLSSDVRRPPLRVLLLEREADAREGWFAELLSSQHPVNGPRVSELFEPAAPVPITPLAGLDLRRRVLQQGLVSAAEHWKQPPVPLAASRALDEGLSRPQFSDPLTLLMAALVAHERKDVVSALSLDRMDLAFEVAAREAKRLGYFLSDTAKEWEHRILRHVVSVVCFCEGLTEEALSALVEADLAEAKVEWNGGPNDLTRIVGTALPPSSREPGHQHLYSWSLEPDTVAEAFVLRYFGEPLPGTSTHAALARCSRSRPAQFARRLFHAWQNFNGDANQKTRLMDWIDVLVNELSVADAIGDGLELLRWMEASLPRETTELRRRATNITRRLHEHTKAALDAGEEALRPEVARLASNLGVRLSALGRREEALARASEAVELYHALAERNPDAFRPNLAASLNNLANALSDLGRREEALQRASEAVELRRALAERNPCAFRRDLAASLNNLANRLSELGRREEALARAGEAVELYHALAERNPDAFRPGLAMSLTNLAPFLSELGRREEALARASEAVELYHALAERNPDAFRPGLATSLNNLATFLSALGRHEEALARASEAVELRRALAERYPDAFRLNLAASLSNVANALSALGRREEALARASEAVELCHALADHNPDAFRPGLAMSLNNLATFLFVLGRREEALARAGEAVELYHALAERNPDAFRRERARSLWTHAGILMTLSRPSDAATALRNAIQSLWPVFERWPPTVADDMETLVKDYVETAQAAGIALDSTVLDPVLQVFGRLRKADDGSEP